MTITDVMRKEMQETYHPGVLRRAARQRELRQNQVTFFPEARLTQDPWDKTFQSINSNTHITLHREDPSFSGPRFFGRPTVKAGVARREARLRLSRLTGLTTMTDREEMNNHKNAMRDDIRSIQVEVGLLNEVRAEEMYALHKMVVELQEENKDLRFMYTEIVEALGE